MALPYHIPRLIANSALFFPAFSSPAMPFPSKKIRSPKIADLFYFFTQPKKSMIWHTSTKAMAMGPTYLKQKSKYL